VSPAEGAAATDVESALGATAGVAAATLPVEALACGDSAAIVDATAEAATGSKGGGVVANGAGGGATGAELPSPRGNQSDGKT